MSFRNNKKGLSIEFLAATMITLISFFVIGGVVSIFTDKLPQIQADQICKTSVAVRATSKVTIAGGIIGKAPSPLVCKSQEFEINAKGKTNKEIIKELLDHSARAWNVWGEGNYGSGLYGNFLKFGGDSCYKYYFIKVKNLKRTITRQQVYDFMISENYTKANTTYWNYMAQNTQYSGFNILDDIEDHNIYMVMFADIHIAEVGDFGIKEHKNKILIANENRVPVETGTWGLVFDFGTKECAFYSGTGGT